MTPAEMLRKIEMLKAEIEYCERTAKLLGGFEDMHRDAMRDHRLDAESRNTHEGIWRAMGDEIKDEMKVIAEMKKTLAEVIERLRQTTVGEAYADADQKGVACV